MLDLSDVLYCVSEFLAGASIPAPAAPAASPAASAYSLTDGGASTTYLCVAGRASAWPHAPPPRIVFRCARLADGRVSSSLAESSCGCVAAIALSGDVCVHVSGLLHDLAAGDEALENVWKECPRRSEAAAGAVAQPPPAMRRSGGRSAARTTTTTARDSRHFIGQLVRAVPPLTPQPLPLQLRPPLALGTAVIAEEPARAAAGGGARAPTAPPRRKRARSAHREGGAPREHPRGDDDIEEVASAPVARRHAGTAGEEDVLED